MSEVAIKKEVSPEIIAQKREVWASMGEAVVKTELSLQLKAERSIAKLKTPTKMEEVAEAELILAEVKREQKLVEGERKLCTTKFDELSKRMMIPEKSFDIPVLNVTTAIITVKKAHESEQAKIQQKKDEITTLRSSLILKKNELDASFRTKVLNAVNLAYTSALETSVAPDKIGAYLNAEIAKVTPELFNAPRPTAKPTFCTFEEHQNIINEIWGFNSQSYIDQFREDLDIRFSDYSIAFNNKAAALQIATTEANEKQLAIEKEKNTNAIASQLEASATLVQAEMSFNAVKALKKSYEVDMTESLDNSIIVMSAFVANKSLIEPMMKVNKWDSFNIGQMKNYLGKCKCNDNAFQPAGITYKEVNKL